MATHDYKLFTIAVAISLSALSAGCVKTSLVTGNPIKRTEKSNN